MFLIGQQKKNALDSATSDLNKNISMEFVGEERMKD
jgi:hypothetical protein